MSDEPVRGPDEDEIDEETAAPLPSRDVMSIIDPSVGIKIPFQPPDGMTTDQGIDERNIGE